MIGLAVLGFLNLELVKENINLDPPEIGFENPCIIKTSKVDGIAATV